ncbi:MAG: aquaporin family protein [Cyclobacteriaceae bacterium]
MTPYFAEFIGTFLLMYFGNGVNANVSLKKTYGHDSGWVVISLGWGLAVFIGVVVAGSISGAHLNPAVTIGLATAEKFEWAQVPGYIGAQMLGAFTGAAVVYLQYKLHFDATEDPATKLGVFSTGPAIPNKPLNLLSEVLGTFGLIFPVFFLVEGNGLGSISALPVALIVVAIGFSLGGTTGYAINPARDLGPRLFHAIAVNKDSNWQYAWIPVIGPVIGAILAGFIYLLL